MSQLNIRVEVTPDMIRSPRIWYVVVTNINCEKRAEDGLKAKGFQTYLPQLTKTVPGGGRKRAARDVQRPLFPRYLFVASERPEFPFFDLAKTNGVESIVRNEGVPLSVPAGVVSEILAREERGEFDYSIKPEPKTLAEVGLCAGQEMRIKTGPFEGLTAVIRAMMPKRKAEVLIHLFGKDQRVKMKLAELEAVA